MFTLPGVGITTLCPDGMHIKHLGTDQYDFGSVVKMLVYHVMLASPELNCSAFMAHLSVAYKEMHAHTRAVFHLLYFFV